MEFNKARKIIGLRVLSDNVIWLLVKEKSVVVVDPSVHEPVIRYINENNFHLEAILQTHHHSDHIGGTKSLIERWPNVKVIASYKEKKRIPFQNISVEDGEILNILGEEVDKVVGVANREKLLTSLLRGDSHLTPYELSENVEFVPEMIRVDRLLLGFNDDKKGVRVVVDEFGGFVGLVGAESVLAVLAGWWRKSNK